MITNARTQDPSKTSYLRRTYEAALVKRFKALRRDIITSIVEHDAFGLKRSRLILHDAAYPRQFAFPRSEEKVAAFLDWLRQQIDNHILVVGVRSGTRIAAHSSWQNTYVYGAYRRGFDSAVTQLEKAGIDAPISFDMPLHLDRLGLLYTRNFEGLRNISEAMSSQIATVLTEGMATGMTPIEIAGAITDRVDAIGLTRARALARTEIIRAHAEASLNTLEQVGIDQMVLNPEASVSTAGDQSVCKICLALAYTAGGNLRIYTLEDARGVLPGHVNCRCSWSPVVTSLEEKRSAA